MAKKFAKQYKFLGLETPAADMDLFEKAERIFRACCEKQGFDPVALPLVDHLAEPFRAFPVAAYRLEVITVAMQDGRERDWNNAQEQKFGPWFLMNNPGFRFNDAYFSCTLSAVGARLCSLDYDDAQFIAIECIAFWADFNDGKLPA